MIICSQIGCRQISRILERIPLLCTEKQKAVHPRLKQQQLGCITTSHRQFSSQIVPAVHPLTCQPLRERGLVRVAGQHAATFLQGLITNDMRCLESMCDLKSMYAMMLNVQGRVLYDLIVYNVTPEDGRDQPVLLVECQKDTIPDFMSTLRRYKLRKKVSLSDASDEQQVWAVFGGGLPTLNLCDSSQVTLANTDPRLKALGHRLILPAGVQGSTVVADCQTTTDPDAYRRHRYQLGVGEGTIDLPPGACFPLECNAVFLNGVSFNKGCYIGQELTARTHHTGVVRKRLMPVTILKGENDVQPGDSVIGPNGKMCGKLRGILGQHGLALLRVTEVIGQGRLCVKREPSEEGQEAVTVGECESHLPSWWPTEEDEVVKMALCTKEGKG